VSVIIVQTDRGARHCLGLVVGGLRGGPSPSGDIFVAGQNIIIGVPPCDMLIFNGDLAAIIFSPSVFRNGSNYISLIYERNLHASGPSTRGSRGVETSFVDKDKRSEKWRNPGRLPFTLRP
jgi:hypothetical protein